MLARMLTIMLGLALAACATVSGKPERYVAQAPAALPAEFRDGKCEAGELDRLLAAYGRVGSTPMMALGDSLYNGMQSLHLNWWEAEWSTPALVALREGLIAADAQGNRTGERQFVAPPYPGHPLWTGGPGLPTKGNRAITYGLDVETVGLPQVLQGALQDEAKALLDLEHRAFVPAGSPGPVFADDIAYEGSIADDMLFVTPAGARKALTEHKGGDSSIEDRLVRLSRERLDTDGAVIADYLFFANADFVLNPMDLDCLKDKSALDEVVLRKPDRVLINLGSNHGIFKVGFYGDTVQACSTKGHGTIANDVGTIFPKRMGEIIDRLAAEPAIRYVYLTPVARPSFLGDLPPDGGEAPVGLGHYYGRYKVDFTLGRTGAAFHGITGNDVRAADRLAADTNQKLRDLVARANARAKRAPGDGKFVVVPLEQGFDHYDFKHTGVVTDSLPLTFRPSFPASVVDRGRVLHLTNLPVRIELTSGHLGLVPRFSQGGLFSFDNMHLSTFGYDLLADQVAAAIEEHEHLAPSPDGLAATRPDAIFSNPDLAPHLFLRNADPDASLRRAEFDAAQSLAGFATRLVDRSRNGPESGTSCP